MFHVILYDFLQVWGRNLRRCCVNIKAGRAAERGQAPAPHAHGSILTDFSFHVNTHTHTGEFSVVTTELL